MLPVALLLFGLGGAATVAATRVSIPPHIDGTTHDAVWQLASPSDSFTQKSPQPGAEPSHETRLRVLYDDEAIYIALECDQQGTPIVARRTRRDRKIESDWVSIDLDTRGDEKSAFHFEVNAAGVLVDGLRFDDTEVNLDWDENWEAETHVERDRWSVEMRIPLRVLRFDTSNEQMWGFQVRRYISDRQETEEWAYIDPTRGGEVSHYGTLGPLERLENERRIEIRPFLSSRYRYQYDDGDLRVSSRLSGGFDGRWRITPDLTLSATAFPDFGQVEADQVVLNLSTSETLFAEKRPFFLEGTDTFSTTVAALYTRRIGHQPADPENVTLAAPVEPIPIYGALMLTGNATERLRLGLLSAVTGPRDARVFANGISTSIRTTPVEPAAIYNAARLRYDVGSHAQVGLTTTAVIRPEDERSYDTDDSGTSSRCPDATTVAPGAKCFHDAYVAGADLLWRSASGAYVFEAEAFGSRIERGPGRRLRDGTRVGDNDMGLGALTRFAKEGGTHWLYELMYEGYSPRFDINDGGYLARQDLHRFGSVGQYRETEPRGSLLKQRYRLELYHRRTFDGSLSLAQGYQINASGKFDNFWNYFVELHYRAAHFDDREFGDGRALERDGLIGLELEGSTDPRKPVVASLVTTCQAIFNGYNLEAEATLAFRVLPQLDVDLIPQFTYTTGEPRFIGDDGDGRPIFGRQRGLGIGSTLRATYTFTPRLTLQGYGQIFVAHVTYHDFLHGEASDRKIYLHELEDAEAPAESPDFDESSINTSIVLRWEVRLGSLIYVVYTHAQSPDAIEPEESGTTPLDRLIKGPSVEVILFKMSYWWG